MLHWDSVTTIATSRTLRLAVLTINYLPDNELISVYTVTATIDGFPVIHVSAAGNPYIVR